MRQLEQALLERAERGTPLGADELIARVDRQLHSEVPVVVPPSRLGPDRWVAATPRWAAGFAAAAVLVLALAVPIWLIGNEGAEPSGPEAPSTTEAPTTTAVSTSVPPTTAPMSTTSTEVPSTTPPTATVAPMGWARIAEPDVFGGEGWQRMSDVAVGSGIAVAVGYDASGGDDDAAVWYTIDGVTWSRVPHDEAVFGGVGHQQIRGVVAVDSGFVAVGFEGDARQHEGQTYPLDAFRGSEAHAAVWRSDDGVSWTRVPHDEAVFGADDVVWMNDVTFGDSKLVAVGTTHQRVEQFATAFGPVVGEPPMPVDADADAVVWTSVDGVEWSRVDAGDAVFGGDTVWQRMYAVAAGGPGFVAVGQEGFDFLGVDDWTPIPDTNPDGIDHVMDNVAAVWTSPDGTTWTRVAHQPALVHSGENATGWATMFDVTATGSGLVAVGRDVWDTLTDRPHPGGAVGFIEGAAIWLSDDGVSWHRVAHEITEWPDMAAVIATDDGDLVAAGGMLGYMTAGAWTSQDDGNTWIQHPYEDTLFGADSTSDAGGPASIQGLAVFGDSVLAVGTFDSDAAVWVGTWTDAGG